MASGATGTLLIATKMDSKAASKESATVAPLISVV